MPDQEGEIPSSVLLGLRSTAAGIVRGPRFRLTLANRRFLDLLGCAPGDELIDGTGPIGTETLERARLRRATLSLQDHPVRVGSARRFWTFDLVPLPPLPGGEDGLLIVADDVTSAVEAGEKARSGARLLDAIMAYAPAGISVATAPDGTITRTSDYASGLLEQRHEALENLPPDRQAAVYGWRDPATDTPLPPDELPLVRAVRHGEVLIDGELLATNSRGERIPILASAGPVRAEQGAVTGSVMIWRDMRRMKAVEAELRDALQAKDCLLHELSHRVKNNFQMVGAILEMQSREVADPDLQGQFREAIGRIRALATIHERLYRKASFDGLVDIGDAIGELCGAIGVASSREVAIDLRAVPLELPEDRATPLLLVANELVSNACKHAFPDGRPGTISVSLETPGSGGVVLTVADDGIGLPQGFRDKGRLGLRLVGELVGQLDGALVVRDGNPTVFEIRFPFGAAAGG